MRKEEKQWRFWVGRDLQALREKRANPRQGDTTYMMFQERFAVHCRRGLHLGIPTGDALFRRCLEEGRGGSKT